ncbi:unnamed protein product [Effrenium voratum]|nr:unnamed protein product [Effrenium voratum]
MVRTSGIQRNVGLIQLTLAQGPPIPPALMGRVRHGVTGEEVLPEDEFATWWEQRRLLREGACEGAATFLDALRREVAGRLQLRNFRQLAVACGEQRLGPASPWLNAELVVLARPYTDAPEHELAELWEAAFTGDAGSVTSLLEEPMDPNTTDDVGRSALHVAAERGHVEVVHCLLDSGADKDRADTRSRHTPMHDAAKNGHHEVVRCLLEAGAEKDKARIGGFTPLYVATRDGHTGVVRCLLHASAATDKADIDGRAPLHVAAWQGNLEVLRCLLDSGAEKDKPDKSGRTPLHVAASKDREEAVRSLLAARADKNKVDTCGDTPLQLVFYNEALRRLLGHMNA